MAHERGGRNPFNPLIVGALAIIVALVAFLVLREGSDMSQQAGIESPPAATSPSASPSGQPDPAPTTPRAPAGQPPGAGSQ